MSDPSRTTATGIPLVTLQEAAEKLSVPIGTLYSWQSRHQITPAALGPGGKGLYKLAEIERHASTTRRRRSRRA